MLEWWNIGEITRSTQHSIIRNYLATEFTESTEIWKQKMEKNLTLQP